MYKQNIAHRYRGFNLMGMFISKDSLYINDRNPGYFKEEDFKMISDFGFNFVKLPLLYRIWSNVNNPYVVNEEKSQAIR